MSTALSLAQGVTFIGAILVAVLGGLEGDASFFGALALGLASIACGFANFLVFA